MKPSKDRLIFEEGLPKKPPVAHDNGFLDRFERREPTLSDRAAYASWVTKLEVAEAAQGLPGAPSLPDALPAYRHFLFEEGRSRRIRYDRFLQNDPSGRVILRSLTIDVQEGVEALLHTRPKSVHPYLRFRSVNTARVSSRSMRYPYPRTENWQKALGAHPIWVDGHLTIRPDFLTAMVNIHMEDRYNFNPGQHDIATGLPDSANGRFEITGLAHQYMNRGTAHRTLRWRISERPASLLGSPDGRLRQPADNRRRRNQI